MNKRITKLFTFFSSVIFLTSCARSDNDLPDKYILMPSGAPTLSVYKLINDDKANVLTDASSIPAAFNLGKSPFIVFDSLKALNILNKQGADAKYKYVKMLTGGNFHLLAFNKSPEEVQNLTIKAEDVVYGFQKENTPDLLFKSIFSEAEGCDVYFNSISDLNAKLLTMNEKYMIDNKVVDYAVVAEPACTVIKEKLSAKNLIIQDINLQHEFKNKKEDRNKDYIPQAGLFVKKDINEDSLIYQTVLEEINNSIREATTNPSSIVNEILNVFEGNAEVAQSNFGFNPNIITKIQGTDGTKNGFGIVPNHIEFSESNIHTFGSLLTK